MQVELLHHTPLWVCSTAIRKCWASEDKRDTTEDMKRGYEEGVDYDWDESPIPCSISYIEECGPKDKALIERIGNKNKHASTLEHLNYSFDIDGISRACLQEVARHRHASMSVKSTRYTLKELKGTLDEDLSRFYVQTTDEIANEINNFTLAHLRSQLSQGLSNDIAKYMLPEAYKTSLVWTINARSLQNFLALRTNKAALWEIRELAYELYKHLPDEHQYLFTEFLYEEIE